jgi:hypothetical protein
LFHPRPAPFQQRTNTSCYLAIPTHGFTVALSVFWGTPPAKPFDCKIRLNSSGALSCDRWADPTGGEPRLSRAFLCFVPGDIIKTSVSFCSQCFAFRCRVYFSFSPAWVNKKPCFLSGKQGLKILCWFGYLLTQTLSILASGFCPRYALDRPRLNTLPRLEPV